MSARTLVSPEAASVDRRTWTAIEIIRPAIVLLSASPTLDVLLVKHADDSDEHVTRLHGVRLIQIPLGRELAWIRFRARFGPVRLPDEFLYREARLYPTRRVHRADAVFEGLSVPLAESLERFPIDSLTRDEFLSLERCRGRVLIAKVRERFARVPLVCHPPPEPWWLDLVGEILTTDVGTLIRRAWRGA